MVFAPDMLVEVSSDEPGFIGVWYVARILGLDDLRAMLEYKDLVTDNGEPLTEEVWLDYVRPIPPPTGVKQWAKGDPVEVFDKDGWWQGVVSDVLPRRRFLVYFQHSEEHSAFPASKIRCRQDWCDGKWNFPVGRAEQKREISGSAGPQRDFRAMNCELQEKEPAEKKRKATSQEQNVDVLTEISVEKLDMSGHQNDVGNLAAKCLLPSLLQGDRTSSINVRTETSNELKLVGEGHHSVSGVRTLGLQEKSHQDRNHGMQVENIKPLLKNVNGDDKIQDLKLPLKSEKHINKSTIENALQSKKAAGRPKLRHSLKCGLTQKPSETAKISAKGKRKVEITAYFWLLKALHSKGFVGWKEELMLTEARCLLRISNEEHASQLRRVISSCIYE